MNAPRTQHEKGFTMFYAVLVASLLLAVGVAIANISYKELILSSTSKESQQAFYAADMGVECVLLHEFGVLGGSPFPRDDTESFTGLTCANTPAVLESGYPILSSDAATTTFTLDFNTTGIDKCVTVEVAKWRTPAGKRRTKIDARGYNTCDTLNLRRVERGLRATMGGS